MAQPPAIQPLLGDLNVRYEADAPLAPLTWYGVGGPARALAHPSSVQQLATLAQRCHEQNVPVYVLGAGANLLVSDGGVDGVVVRLDDPAFRRAEFNKTAATVGAGYDLGRLVLEAARRGLSGLEGLAGIPASLGGAVRMNAGGAFGEIGRSVRRVEVMDAAGKVYYRERDDLSFTYRRSNIVARFITDVELELGEDDPEGVMRRVKEVFAYKSTVQPLGARSAGCAFKNPPAPGGQGAGGDGTAPPRLSAGRLIDQAGLKGHRIGGAEVSPRHANFILAHPGCAAGDILALIQHVEKVVQDKTGIHLEREVVIWP